MAEHFLSFLPYCFAVLKAQTMSGEVLMQLLDFVLTWHRNARAWLSAVLPVGWQNMVNALQ